LKSSGLGKPFGKASLANTALGISGFVPMRGRSSWILEGSLRYPSEAWPDEALERGLSRPMAKRRKNWRGKVAWSIAIHKGVNYTI